MNERDALLRHVLAHPDDDAPRLVMADWFDEHGEADRAAFIRLQIAEENEPLLRGRVRVAGEASAKVLNTL